VLVTLVCFAAARLVWTFLVVLAGLPVRASCFVGERFFRLEGTARARGVFPREPAGRRFLFGFRLGMAISSLRNVECLREGAVAMDWDEPSLATVHLFS